MNGKYGNEMETNDGFPEFWIVGPPRHKERTLREVYNVAVKVEHQRTQNAERKKLSREALKAVWNVAIPQIQTG